MSALDKINVEQLQGMPLTQEGAKRLASQAIWNWFRENQDEVVFKVGIGKVAIVRRVRHLRFIIERIAGPER
jgi:hypothetical protein